MRRLIIILVLALLVVGWWVMETPRPEIQIADSISIDRTTEAAIRAVDRSSEFAVALEQFPSKVPAFDDAVFDHGLRLGRFAGGSRHGGRRRLGPA